MLGICAVVGWVVADTVGGRGETLEGVEIGRWVGDEK